MTARRLSSPGLALVCICLATALSGCAAPRPIETVREVGDFEFKRGEYAKAAVQYQEIAKRYPGDWEGQYQLGLSLLKLGEASGARRALEVAHSLRPRDEDVADALAEAMYMQDDKNQLYAFMRGRAEATQSPEVYVKLATYALAMGDADSAKSAAETAIILDSGQTTEPYLAGYAVAQRIGDMDQAVRRLRQAYGINPEDRRVLALLDDLNQVVGPTLALPPGR